MKQLTMYDDALLEHDLLTEPSFTPRTATNVDEMHASKRADSTVEPCSKVTEIILAKDSAQNIQLLLPMLTHLTEEQRWLAWIDPPMELLQQWSNSVAGKHAEDIMVLRSNATTSAAQLGQKALAAGTCHAVIMWTDHLSARELAEIEQASAKGDSHGIVLRFR